MQLEVSDSASGDVFFTRVEVSLLASGLCQQVGTIFTPKTMPAGSHRAARIAQSQSGD